MPYSTELGREGELLTANVRLAVASVATLLPLGNVIGFPNEREAWIGLIAGFATIVIGVAIRSLAKRDVPPRWLGIVSSIIDVSLISGVNAALVLAGQPHAATSGRVFFSLYLVVLSLTCLRYDSRLCILGGAVAVAEYVGIVLWAAPRMVDPGLSHPTYGAFRWDTQLARIAILMMATAINVMVVRQSRKFLDASLHDLLTALPNRRHCDLRLDAAVASASRSGRGFVLAFADIDYFKTTNDRYGHAAGDHVLRAVARELSSLFRLSDVVGRWGGEEFMILCLDADVAGVLERIRKCHERFAEHAISIPGSRDGVRLTLSIGVAAYPADGLTVTDLVGCADRRLYVAKESGRNRVVAA